MLYHPRWKTVTQSIHFWSPDEKAKLHSMRKNTNGCFKHLNLNFKALTPAFHLQISYHELLIRCSKRFLLIVIFFPFTQIYANDDIVRRLPYRLALSVTVLCVCPPHLPLAWLLACLTCPPTPPLIQKLFADNNSLRCYSVASAASAGQAAQGRCSTNTCSLSWLCKAALSNSWARAQTTPGHPQHLTWSLCLWVL